ncbi:uncharacterized protein LOC130313966 isoform X2 [Hyla sarda]|nr:uncharacterized protein LOC130313966 isoform X2 [Hyla sarda]XP_056408674.1 uncharacterized protein LOC130313966 isoform X2 [Hyla sarda]XP_056408675.1 uncharacterized protein LOC130313966 isoform X2 [Hyla sarda]
MSGVEHSSLNMTISYDQHVKDITWKYENNGKRSLIAKIKNGKMVGNIDDGFKLFDSGRVLSINNLTKNHYGLYIADATLLNDTTIEEEFIVTEPEPVPPAEVIPESLPPDDLANHLSERSYMVTIFSIIIILVFVPVCLYKNWKRSSNTIEQDGQKEVQTNQNENVAKERGNEENVKISIEDTGTEESLFIKIPHLFDKYSEQKSPYSSKSFTSSTNIQQLTITSDSKNSTNKSVEEKMPRV